MERLAITEAYRISEIANRWFSHDVDISILGWFYS